MNKFFLFLFLVGSIAFGLDNVVIQYGDQKAKVIDGKLQTSAVVNVGTVTVGGIAYGETILIDNEGDKADVTKNKEMIISERLVVPITLSGVVGANGSTTMTYTPAGTITLMAIVLNNFVGSNFSIGGGIGYAITIGSYELFGATTPSNPMLQMSLNSGIRTIGGTMIKIVSYNNTDVEQQIKSVLLAK